MKTEKELTAGNGLAKSGVIYLVRIYFQLLLMAATFFIAAGNLFIGRAWLYFGFLALVYTVSSLIFIKFNPELLNERAKERENTKSWDKLLLSLYLLIGFFGINLVAGLDVGRFHWSGLAMGYMIPGTIIYLVSAALGAWAMVTNKYFEATVRIQEDRDHHVVRDGPYRIVRHPGYLAILLGIAAIPLMIGSLYAFYCSAAVFIIMITRTALEDGALRQELKGYSDYAQKVRYRLIPYIW
jgi:protein-S-isoprenylcysteine O-methyltransferase Ste14